MSVTNWFQGDVFTIRIYKRWVTNPARIWANNYEIVAEAGGNSPTILKEVADTIVGIERAIHSGFVIYDRAVISTYVPDGEPYNPFSFVVSDLAGVLGLRSLGGEQPLDIKSVLFARFEAETGRPGRRFYRGCLGEGDVNATASGEYGPVLAQTQQAIETAFDTLLTDLSANFDMRLTLASGVSPLILTRNVTNVNASQVTSRQLRRRTKRKFGDVGGAPDA